MLNVPSPRYFPRPSARSRTTTSHPTTTHPDSAYRFTELDPDTGTDSSGTTLNSDRANGKTVVIKLRYGQLRKVMGDSGTSNVHHPDVRLATSEDALLFVKTEGIKPEIDVNFDKAQQEVEFKVMI